MVHSTNTWFMSWVPFFTARNGDVVGGVTKVTLDLATHSCAMLPGLWRKTRLIAIIREDRYSVEYMIKNLLWFGTAAVVEASSDDRFSGASPEDAELRKVHNCYTVSTLGIIGNHNYHN